MGGCYFAYKIAQKGAFLKTIRLLILNNMAIADGGTTRAEYPRVTFSDVDTIDRQNVRAHLKKYCELDTMGMVWIVEKLKEIAL